MVPDLLLGASPFTHYFEIQLDLFSYYPHETWKPVLGYEMDYAVSSHGRVKRCTKTKMNPPNFVLSPILNSSGYFYVNLPSSRRRKVAYVHTLVAEAFLGSRPPQHHINHKDAVKTNNHLLNLEYVTVGENVAHGGLSGSNKHVWLTPDAVRSIRQMHQELKSYKLVADFFHVDAAHVYRIVTRQSWKHVT